MNEPSEFYKDQFWPGWREREEKMREFFNSCPTREDVAEIGRQWLEDSSLSKWFPLTAEKLNRAEKSASYWRDECRRLRCALEAALTQSPKGQPCGECHLQPGERCDVCGAQQQ